MSLDALRKDEEAKTALWESLVRAKTSGHAFMRALLDAGLEGDAEAVFVTITGVGVLASQAAINADVARMRVQVAEFEALLAAGKADEHAASELAYLRGLIAAAERSRPVAA